MVNRFSFINEIKAGRVDWKIKVRVISMWTPYDFKNPGVISSMEMILADEKGHRIHATVKRACLDTHPNMIQEGFTYEMRNLAVGQSEPNLKTTKHKFKLMFIQTTRVIPTNDHHISVNCFQFLSFDQIIQGHDDGWSSLLNVIGHVVEKDDIKEKDKQGKKSKLVDVVLEDLDKNRLICTLWGNFADQMFNYLNTTTDNNDSIVVILQLGKRKKFNGQVGISNAYNGTKLLINPDVAEVTACKEKLQSGDLSVTQVVSQMSSQQSLSFSDDLITLRRLTISDLIESIQIANGSLLATIIEIDLDKDWWFQSCSKCYKHVVEMGTKHYCEKCKIIVAVPRFKVNATVIDETGSTCLIMFDAALSKFLGKTASELLGANDKAKDKGYCPPKIDALVDKEFLFRVEVSDANILYNFKTYKVRLMTDDKESIDQFKIMHSIKDMDEDNDYNEQQENLTIQVDDNIKDTSEQELSASKIELCRQIEEMLSDNDGETPSSKPTGKRSIDNVEISLAIDDGGTQTSSTKIPKKVKIKIEPKD